MTEHHDGPNRHDPNPACCDNHPPSGGLSRRRFLAGAGATGLGATGMGVMAANLEAMAAAATAASAQAGGAANTGYKALVGILLAGGNDSFNMLVPGPNPPGGSQVASHSDYVTARTSMALPLSDLLTLGTDGAYLLHDAMPGVRGLYNSGGVGFLANAGPLVQPLKQPDGTTINPLTKANTPRGLFSHIDQIIGWQVVAEGTPQSNSGVLGRMADVNHDPTATGLASVAGSISAAGTNLMQRGQQSRHYTLGQDGPIPFANWGSDFTGARQVVYEALGARDGTRFNPIYRSAYPTTFKEAYARHMEDAIDNGAAYLGAYQAATLSTSFSDTNLANQLKVIARSIKMQKQNQVVGRQVYFATLGGWDHHQALLRDHRTWLGELDTALTEFAAALMEPGVDAWDDVVTFTVSDFGRTMRSNGSGTDHGWGGNHIIMGGSVAGGAVHGHYPTGAQLQPGSNLDADRGGRMIPTTSADEYLAELALWFGVPSGQLSTVVPNLSRFHAGSSAPIGFMS
jgi:uncharacterized protein (DUF1501 family)